MKNSKKHLKFLSYMPKISEILLYFISILLVSTLTAEAADYAFRVMDSSLTDYIADTFTLKDAAILLIECIVAGGGMWKAKSGDWLTAFLAAVGIGIGEVTLRMVGVR